MERPAYLREDLYKDICADINDMSVVEIDQVARNCGYSIGNVTKLDLLTAILARPSMYLAQRGILTDSGRLAGIYIEFDDGKPDEGHTYLIDTEAATEIANKELTVLLRSGKEGALVTRERIEEAFRNGCFIDYSERFSI